MADIDFRHYELGIDTDRGFAPYLFDTRIQNSQASQFSRIYDSQKIAEFKAWRKVNRNATTDSQKSQARKAIAREAAIAKKTHQSFSAASNKSTENNQ